MCEALENLYLEVHGERIERENQEKLDKAVAEAVDKAVAEAVDKAVAEKDKIINNMTAYIKQLEARLEIKTS